MKDFGGATRRRRRDLIDAITHPDSFTFSELMFDEAGTEMDAEAGADTSMLDEAGNEMQTEYNSMAREETGDMHDEADVLMNMEWGLMLSELSTTIGLAMYSEGHSFEMQAEDGSQMLDEDYVPMLQEGAMFWMYDENDVQMASEHNTLMLQEV